MGRNQVSRRKRTSDLISLADEDAVKEAVWSSILGLWDVVNTLTRLRPSRSKRYRVCIFGSARVKPGMFGYEETKRAAHALARMGCDIVTGGGPGLMQAANEGASSAPERSRSYGIRVTLPFEQNVNAFVSKHSSTERFSRGFISSSLPPTPSSSLREVSGLCWK